MKNSIHSTQIECTITGELSSLKSISIIRHINTLHTYLNGAQFISPHIKKLNHSWDLQNMITLRIIESSTRVILSVSLPPLPLLTTQILETNFSVLFDQHTHMHTHVWLCVCVLSIDLNRENITEYNLKT